MVLYFLIASYLQDIIPCYLCAPCALYFFINMTPLLALVAFVYGLVLLIKCIICKDWVLKKFAANIAAILLAFLILFSFIYAAYIKTHELALRATCSSFLNSLSKCIFEYANENNGYFPDCNQWCDLLIMYADAGTRIMRCEGSDAKVGESSYAMNINLKGKKLSKVEPDTVILFETNYGKDPNGRDVTVSYRYSYKVLKEKGEDISFFGEKPEKQKVYRNRWNQAGGVEMISAQNHRGEGANILLADGSTIWVFKEDFNNLNWGNEANIE